MAADCRRNFPLAGIADETFAEDSPSVSAFG